MQYIEKIGYRSSAMVRAKLENIDYYPFHMHENTVEIICVLNGSICIYDSAAAYTLHYGDVHIFNRNDSHKIFSNPVNKDDESPEKANIILTIHIDLNHYHQYFHDIYNAYFICDTYENRNVYQSEMKYLRFLLANVYRGYSGNCSDTELEEMTIELLSLLISQFQDYVYKEDEKWTANIVRLQNTDQQLQPGGIYHNYQRVYRIVDYVSTHFSEKIYLREIADMEYLSVAHLSRYIKVTLGLNFSQLVSLTRCEEAARLLSSTNKTVDQIAEAAGFVNRKHLSSQFQRWFKQTPTSYRKEIQKDLRADSVVQLGSFDYSFALRLINMYFDGY